MKCPRCWANKVCVREVSKWKKILTACLLLRPMKCHHCYHKFYVPLFLAIGKRVGPPGRKARPSRLTGRSYAARHYAATRRRQSQRQQRPRDPGSGRADAA